jgi:hypothetical protein
MGGARCAHDIVIPFLEPYNSAMRKNGRAVAEIGRLRGGEAILYCPIRRGSISEPKGER